MNKIINYAFYALIIIYLVVTLSFYARLIADGDYENYLDYWWLRVLIWPVLIIVMLWRGK